MRGRAGVESASSKGVLLGAEQCREISPIGRDGSYFDRDAFFTSDILSATKRRVSPAGVCLI